MHPVLPLALQGAAMLANPAPMDSVVWLPEFYDGYYAFPNGGPTWSRDDEQLAFGYFFYTPPQYFSTTLEILQSDGTWRHCLLEPFTFGGAAWSPVGDEIAADNSGRIMVFSPKDCAVIREITGGRDPKWSGDGQRIVFSVGSNDGGAIYTASAAGGDVRHLVDDGVQPDWSPSGMSIVFVRAGNLWTISIDGTNDHPITQSGHDEWPAWSRDGSWIAFTRNDPDWEHTGVWVVAANGGPATQVTPVVAGEQRVRPSWSQDGTRLTYFVLATEYRIGIGVMHDVVPLAVRMRSWTDVKKTYR